MPYRYAQLPHSSIRFRYFYPPNRAWPILPTFKSFAHFLPVRLQVPAQVFHFHSIYSCRSFIALYSLQRGLHVLPLEHCFPRPYVGFSIVSCWERLGALNNSHRLHLLRLFISLSIREFLPSLFIPQTAHCTYPLFVQPFLEKKLLQYYGFC